MNDEITDNSLDKIRDLLFGRQLGGVDEQIAQMRIQLAALESSQSALDSKLESQLEDAIRAVRADIDKRADELTQALGQEIRHRLDDHPSRNELAGLLNEIAERIRRQ